MLTDEQISKAQIALLPTGEDLEKWKALKRHDKAQTGMDLYGLPYRVYRDYLRRWDSKSISERETTVQVNPMYPAPGYPMEHVKRVTESDLKRPGLPDRLPFECLETLNDDIQVEIKTYWEDLRPWKLHDDNWCYYFFHFLRGYDFLSFTEFDFYGTSDEQEPGDIALLRKVYARYLETYEKDPEQFMKEEPHITKAEREKYFDTPYKPMWDKETLQERERLINQMGIKPSYTDEEKKIVFGE